MRDVQVVATETGDGVAMVFITTGDVEGLRRHVRHMAEQRNQMATGGMINSGKREGMHGGQMGGQMGGHMGGMHDGQKMKEEMRMQMVPARASVVDIDGGARLVLTPVEPAQLASLREQTAAHAAMMQQGRCPMMAEPSQPAKPDVDHERHPPAGT